MKWEMEKSNISDALDTVGKGLTKAIERLGVHDHLCLIYETREEQFAVVVPFMRIGLERGEKCVYIVDDNTSAAVINEMKSSGIEVRAMVQSGQLAILSKQDAYLQQGHFDPDWMIGFLQRATDEAKAEGFSALRVTGEMTWVLGGDPGTERLLEYEAKLNYFLPQNDALAICQYNRSRFSPEVIKDVIATHPLVIYGGMVCRNFYYLPPDNFLDAKQPDKEIDRLLANIRDTAEIEDALLQSEARCQSIIEGQTELICRYLPDGRLSFVNEVYARYYGKERQELLHENFIPHIPEPDLAMLLERIKGITPEAPTTEFEHRVIMDDGTVRWQHWVHRGIFSSTAELLEHQAVGRDITDRKRAEETLLRTMKELRDVNAELAQFNYVVAHDLKAPIRAISNYSAFLEEDLGPAVSDEIKKYLSELRQSAVEAGTLIEDLLHLAKIGSSELEPVAVEMGDFMKKLVRSMNLSPTIEIHFDSEWPTIMSDPHLLRQIFQNLIDNAQKYTIATQNSIEIGCLPAENESITFFVRDNGIGIGSAYYEKIFGLFERLHAPKEYSGTGVGLAIVKKAVNRLGGTIRLESTEGKGSTFYVILPIVTAR